ncbi:MAG: ATP-binding cassette domain-containing protein [Dehalococcoidia bacterium]|nr:ATP-binding cassette domain-containing protein [Dehalococcoidia bacterium]
MSAAHSQTAAIVVEDVDKTFRLTTRRDIKSAVLHPFRNRQSASEPFSALSGVSLTVARGESLGVIGANGSGKSTLLRLMAGISRPTRGRVEVRGRVSALLELGAGFHDQISGRDNAVINAVLLGLSLREANERLDEMIAFAELEQFIDEPMRTYSYGMYLRLGFSVAVHVRAEVLLIDEVLAVGDAEFQAKCFAHIERLRRDGATIVIVSHDLAAIERFTDRVVLLDGGRILAEGEPADVVARYRAQATTL